MMPTILYGKSEITFQHKISKDLKHAYVTVDTENGVILKSPQISDQQARDIIKKRGAWILKKLKLVRQQPQEKIVSGSRIPYLGKRYYTEVSADPSIQKVQITFTHSKFQIRVNPDLEDRQEAILERLNKFYLEKAKEKIRPRIERWCMELGVVPDRVIFKRLRKRWGSCTRTNRLVINSELVQLSYSLIDYVIVHELVHIAHKDHSKEFWNRVEDVLPFYQSLHDQIMRSPHQIRFI